MVREADYRALGLVFKIIGCSFFNNLEEVKIDGARRQPGTRVVIVSIMKVVREKLDVVFYEAGASKLRKT